VQFPGKGAISKIERIYLGMKGRLSGVGRCTNRMNVINNNQTWLLRFLGLKPFPKNRWLRNPIDTINIIQTRSVSRLVLQAMAALEKIRIKNKPKLRQEQAPQFPLTPIPVKS
jgi:hypothetical protein